MPERSTTQSSHRHRAEGTGRGAGPRTWRFLRVLFLLLLTLLLVVAGVWASWGTVRHALYAGSGDRGVVLLEHCDRTVCTGPFEPAGEGGAVRSKVRLEQTVGRQAGDSVKVALRPDTDEVIRTGFPGFLYAWLPLTGALLLASLIIAGGLRLRRVAWIVGGTGLTLLAATFFAR